MRIHVDRAGEPEPDVFGSLEPEPLEKKQEPEPLGKKSGARAAKKLAGSSALREDKKHEEILYFRYSSLGKIVSFYGKKNTHFTLFFFAVYLTSLRGKEYYKSAYNFNSQIMSFSVSLLSLSFFYVSSSWIRNLSVLPDHNPFIYTDPGRNNQSKPQKLDSQKSNNNSYSKGTFLS